MALAVPRDARPVVDDAVIPERPLDLPDQVGRLSGFDHDSPPFAPEGQQVLERFQEDQAPRGQKMVRATAWTRSPAPTQSPSVAAAPIDAAVVRPWTESPVLRLAPAPGKPIP